MKDKKRSACSKETMSNTIINGFLFPYEYMMDNDICKAFQLYAVREYLKEHETITKMELWRILNENAPKDESNRFQQLTITKKKLQEYFPVFYTKSQMEKVLFSLLEEWKEKNSETES